MLLRQVVWHGSGGDPEQWGVTVGYSINRSQVINEIIDGEAIMINLATGTYYSMDTVGGQIWALLERSCSEDQIVAELRSSYDASDEVIRAAVEDLLERLAAEHLLVREDDEPADGAAAPSSTPAGQAPFTAPRLEKFTDMQDLILLDPVHEVDERGWPHVADQS